MKKFLIFLGILLVPLIFLATSASLEIHVLQQYPEIKGHFVDQLINLYHNIPGIIF
jgi:hypothetical protein